MEILGTVVVLLAVAAIVGMRLANARSATLVLQEFKVDRLPSKRPKKEVEIVGRLQGGAVPICVYRFLCFHWSYRCIERMVGCFLAGLQPPVQFAIAA